MTESSNNEAFLPFMITELPINLLLKGKQELGENDVSISKGLQHLREFIKKNDLPSELDDELLLKFLRIAKFNTQKAEERLFDYCKMRKEKSDYVELLDEKLVEKILDQKIMGFLPYRDSYGRAIMYGRAYGWNPDLCDTVDLFRCGFALTHFGLSFPPTCISGVSYVVDGRVQNFSHYFHFIKSIKDHVVDLLSMPIRFQKVDGIYIDSFRRFLFSILKPIAPKKLVSRISLHQEGFVDDVCPPSILPNELGGTMGDLSNDHFKTEFMSFIKQFKSENYIFLK